MKILILTIWCLLPIGVAAYHFGPGQEHLKLDEADVLLATARAATDEQDWPAAVDAYQQALAQLPKDRTQLAYRIRLESAKAKLLAAKLPEAREELEELVIDLSGDESAASSLRDEARSALANSRYYMTYLMKLEGLPDSAWEPEIEAARQEYKFLALQAADPELARQSEDDLEAAIRLARMDPAELYGLPIPVQ